MIKLIVTISISILFTLNGLSQEVDYNTFKGKPVNIVIDVPLNKFSFYTYDKKNLTEKQDLRRRTLKEAFGDYASGPENLLNKIYHSKNKNDLSHWLEDESSAERFEIKKVKDYTTNHFIFKYVVEYNYGEGSIGVIKYGEIKDGIEIGEYTLQARRGTVGRGYKATDISELEALEYIMQSLSAAAFLKFYRTYDSEDDSINALREKVRSSSNKLNFDKLATVLKEVEQNNPKLFKQLRTMEMKE